SAGRGATSIRRRSICRRRRRRICASAARPIPQGTSAWPDPGGQASRSMRIEDNLGFPPGITGFELAERGHPDQQIRRRAAGADAGGGAGQAPPPEFAERGLKRNQRTEHVIVGGGGMVALDEDVV